MSDLTSELNLALCVDNDDTADYLTKTAGLRGSLVTLDGLFNQGTGHNHNGTHQGGSINPTAFADGSIPGAKLIDGQVTYPKLAANMHESLWAGCLQTTGTNYTVVKASNVMFVWCSAAVTVTLTAGIDRPITVRANTGNTTVLSTSGSVIGGSADTSTGAVINGRVNQGDALTYKWDGTNWAAV